jgi:hypothetical protein
MSDGQKKKNTEATKEQLTAIPDKAIAIIVKQAAQAKFMRLAYILTAVAFISVILWINETARESRAADFETLTKVQNGWTLKDKGIIEKKETYRKFMVNVHRVKGVKYAKREDREYGLKPGEVGIWIDLHWDMSVLFKFNPYEVPILQVCESSIDPYSPGPTGEIPSLAQIMPATADRIPAILRRFSKGRQSALKIICSKYNVNYATLHDGDPNEYLSDYRYATVAQYIIIIDSRDHFDYNQMWYISAYNKGFLWGYYKGGKGELPTYYTVRGEKYDVAGYWIKFNILLETFNDGQLEPAMQVVSEWQAQRERMIASEKRFVKSIETVKKVDKSFKNLKTKHSEMMQAYTNMQKTTLKAKDDLRKLVPQIQNFKGNDIRVVLNKYKGPIRSWLKENDQQTKTEVRNRWLIAITGLLTAMLIYSIISWLVGNAVAKKYLSNRKK